MYLLKHFKELSVRPKNAKELKGLILQLAVQGKLTSNWREINNETKLDLVKLQKVSKKNLSFLIKESESIKTIEVPSTWLKIKFKTLFEMQGGSQPPKSMFSSESKNGYVQLFQIRDFGKKPVPVYVPSKSVTKFCTEDDIMIGRYGASIGKVFYGKNGAYNVALVKLIWDRELIVQDFVYQIFSSQYMQDFFQNCTRSAQAGFNKTDMGELVIPIPPLEEQKAIVAVVEALFKEVEPLEQLTVERINLKEKFALSALNQLTINNPKKEWTFLQEHFHSFFNEKNNVTKFRETILQLAVQGKLTSSWRASNQDSEDVSVLMKRIQKEKAQLIKDKKIKSEISLPPINKDKIPYEIPESWIWCKLEDLATITGGVTKGKRNQKDLINCPYLRVANVQRGFLNLELMKEILVSKDDFQKYQLKENDLLIIEGGDPDKVGRCAIWSSEILGCIYQNHVFRVRPYLDSTMNNHFFMQFINSRITRDYYESCAKRTTNLASINKTQMRNTPIAFPPLNEQNAIVEKVNILMSLCDALETEIDISQEQSEKLMQSVLREIFETNDSL